MTARASTRRSAKPPPAIACARIAVAALAALDEGRLVDVTGQADPDVARRMAGAGRLAGRIVERARTRYDLPSPQDMLRQRDLFERDGASIARRVGLAGLVRSLGAAVPRATLQAMTQTYGRDDMTFALAHARLARRAAPAPSDPEAVAALGRAIIAEIGDPADALLDRWRGGGAVESDTASLVRLARDGDGAQRR